MNHYEQTKAVMRKARERALELIRFAAFHGCGDDLMPSNGILAELHALRELSSDVPSLLYACENYREQRQQRLAAHAREVQKRCAPRSKPTKPRRPYQTGSDPDPGGEHEHDRGGFWGDMCDAEDANT